MIEMVLLNRNIPSPEAEKLVREGQKKRSKLINQMLDNAEKMECAQRDRYISMCTTFICMI